jgi:hypothetical protein
MGKTEEARKKVLAWVLGGVGIEIAGAVLIWQSLPDFGGPTIAGLVCVVVGSLIVTWGLVQRARLHPPPGTNPPPAAGDWLPETELRAAAPRAVRLSRSGRRMVTWWVLMLLVLPVYGYFVWQRTSSGSVDYRYEYIQAEATIHDMEVRESSGGEKFYLYYNFESLQVPGRRRASTVVSAQQYGAYEIGDTLKVLYLAPNPTVHELPELAEDTPRPRVVWLVVGLAALLLLLFEAIRRRHHTLATSGVAAPGKISMLRRRGAGSVYAVEYEAGSETRTLRGTERTQRLRQGDTVTVLYRPEKPEEALLYRLSMYEARPPAE